MILVLMLIQACLALKSHALEVRWLGVAGLSISDGDTTILIDPVFTKPTLRHWLFGSPFRSDLNRVDQGLKKARVQKVNAIFASHGHFDHSVDLARISQHTGGVIYGGESLRRMVTSDPDVPTSFSELKDLQPVRVGRFQVTAYRRTHPPIFHLSALQFLPGEVSSDFDFRFYEYREGEVWGFRVEHPEGKLLVDQSSHFFDGNEGFARNLDAYFVGVANKRSLQDLVERNILRVKAPLVVPLHFDFFLLQSDRLEGLRMPFMQLEEIGSSLRALAPDVLFKTPILYEPISVQNSARQ